MRSYIQSFQLIISKEMDSENYEIIYCPEDDEYRVYCDICDKLCIERFYKKHLNSQTHINNVHKRQIISNNSI